MLRPTALVLLAVCLPGLSLPAADLASGSKPVPTSLAPEHRGEVNRLLQEYRAAGTSVQKKQEICRKALMLDAAAAPLLLTAIQNDVQPQVRRYVSKFQAQAATTAKRKVGKASPGKILKLQASVREMQKLGDDFTKQLIVEKIDPIIEQLREALLVSRAEVLEKSPDLQADRKKLEALGQLIEQCRVQLPPPSGKGRSMASPQSFETYLQGEEELAAALATPQDAKTRAVLTTNAKLAEKLDPEEARAILECNVARGLLGLPALAIDLKLCEAARDHSCDMERLKFFSHESPVSGKKTPWERAKLFGTTAGAENIHAGSKDGKGAHKGWFHSPGHHKNQMGKHTRIGVGRSGKYFTQLFG